MGVARAAIRVVPYTAGNDDPFSYLEIKIEGGDDAIACNGGEFKAQINAGSVSVPGVSKLAYSIGGGVGVESAHLSSPGPAAPSTHSGLGATRTTSWGPTL